MTTGEGGLITTDDDRLADWLRLYRNQGMRERYHHEMLGYNFRLTDLAAAIGLCQLDKLERNTARRQAIAARYDAAFAGLPIRTPVIPAGRTHVFHQYTIAVERRPRRRSSPTSPRPGSAPGSTTRSRSIASRTSSSAGIHADLPVTDAAAGAHAVAADVPGLPDEDQATVIAAVRAAVERRRRPYRDVAPAEGAAR